MHIKKMKIKNFRGLDINIDEINTTTTIIIGKNDSGKTNICHAILKVLDYKKRRIPFVSTDSTNSNNEDINIEVTLSVDDLNDEQLGTIGEYISNGESGKEFIIKLVSKNNDEIEEYEDYILKLIMMYLKCLKKIGISIRA